MFIKVFLMYILGYVRVTVQGYYIERFINICTNKKILIWNLKRTSEAELHLNIGIKDFKKLSKVSRKTKCRVKINAKRGVPFLLNRYRKRKIFLLLLIAVSVCIYASSKYIWNIEVQEENGYQIEDITEDLKEAGLSVGSRISSVDEKDVINKIRLKRSDIAWMGIETKGTNVIVRVSKAEEKPEIIDESEYCNIVANKSGTITKITAQNGTAQVNIGDTVSEGTVLIAGIMEGKYTGTRYVHSIGEVEAIVEYTKTEKIYYKQEEYNLTGQEENKYAIKLNNFEINFNKSVSKFEIYDTINEEKKIKLFSDFYLPISIIKTTNKEQEKIEKTYSLEEATNIGIKKLEEELECEIDETANILRKKC